MFNLPLNIEQRILIQRPSSDVFDFVGNFENWPKWSPWLCQEPQANYKTGHLPGKVGHSQEWSGKYIGSGTMEITSIKPGEELCFDLNIQKPWKSQSKVKFIVSNQGDSTEILWTMEGSIPLFLFFLKRTMVALIANDYKRGLEMLKEFLENGKVHSKVVRVGKVDQGGLNYISIKNSSSLDDIGPSMEADFEKLDQLQKENDLPEPHAIFSISHDYNFVKNKTIYSVCYGYNDEVSLPEDSSVTKDEMPKHRALQYNHIGSYRHLGNAWVALVNSARTDKLKPLKSIHPYEIYMNKPTEVSEADIKTEIFFPIV